MVKGRLTHAFDYGSCLEAAERVGWRLHELLPEGTKLDLSCASLPDALAGTERIGALRSDERLLLNHIRGNSYVHLFAFVEEYIVAMVVHHASRDVFGDETTLRSLLRFAEEECKHQMMFKRYGRMFAEAFRAPCELLPGAEAVASLIMSNDPMAVLLVTLHLELVTQQHYVECFSASAANERIDPLFRSMFRHHWLEEAQHAKLDVLQLDRLSVDASDKQTEDACAQYLDVLHSLDGVLRQQAGFDLDALERTLDRTFSQVDRDSILDAQTEAYRRTFLVMGISNPQLVRWAGELSPRGQRAILGTVSGFSGPAPRG